jgi:hypothetical protein
MTDKEVKSENSLQSLDPLPLSLSAAREAENILPTRNMDLLLAARKRLFYLYNSVKPCEFAAFEVVAVDKMKKTVSKKQVDRRQAEAY